MLKALVVQQNSNLKLEKKEKRSIHRDNGARSEDKFLLINREYQPDREDQEEDA